MPLIVLCCLLSQCLRAQDSVFYAKLYALPDKLFSRIDRQSQRLEDKLTKQTEKYLSKLQKREQKLRRALYIKDSAAAKRLFNNGGYNMYEHPQFKTTNAYSGHLDSMRTVLQFLNAEKILNPLSGSNNKLSSALTSYRSLQQKLDYTERVKQYARERQRYLQQQLQHFGLTKELKRLQKDVYYYRAQIDEYKRTLEDPSKLEEKLLQLANRIPAFKEFFRKNSQLASLFRLPVNDPLASAAPIPGLQTRSAIQQDMLQRFGTGPDISRAMQQNIQDAQTQLNRLKQKVSRLGGNGSDVDMPNFKPNKQKVKSFWQRIELGANVQSVKSNGFFPVTSDVALTAGYKLNDKSTAGIGVSYKVGWGQNIRQIRITHEGISLRAYTELQLKASIWITGGAELNYRSQFHSFQILKDYSAWQRSALIGISKKYRINKKFNGNLQLLFDALYAQQIPRSQPILFRLGYVLK